VRKPEGRRVSIPIIKEIAARLFPDVELRWAG
jgi:hypothetical protein